MIHAHRADGKPYANFQALTGIDLGAIHDDPLTPEDLARNRPVSPIKWDKETTLPDGTVIRSAQGCVAISTPYREDGKGWNP